MEYNNDDFVLKVRDSSQNTESIIHKYDAFLNAITDENFSHRFLRQGTPRFSGESRHTRYKQRHNLLATL